MVGKPGLLSPSLYLRQRSLHKGLFGGHRGWMVVGVMVWGPRLVKRFLGRQEQLIATERLLPGQSIQLEAHTPLTRRQRKAAERIAAEG
ncbi:MAG: hypothetical protein HY826_09140 [Actinobacteria bacterium]|nr:hypothetical protein [Actinomycetota bacterium]